MDSRYKPKPRIATPLYRVVVSFRVKRYQVNWPINCRMIPDFASRDKIRPACLSHPCSKASSGSKKSFHVIRLPASRQVQLIPPCSHRRNRRSHERPTRQLHSPRPPNRRITPTLPTQCFARKSPVSCAGLHPVLPIPRRHFPTQPSRTLRRDGRACPFRSRLTSGCPSVIA